MLKLKLSKAPPENACLLEYITGTKFDSQSNVGLKDISFLWAENRARFNKQAQTISYDTAGDHELITSSNIIVGNVSARYRDLPDAVPLPWRHRLGGNTELFTATSKQYLYAPLSDGINPSSANTAYQALYQLRGDIKILELDGSISDIYWDVNFGDITAAGDRRVAIGGAFGWDLYIYIDRETTIQRPLLAQYTAIDELGNVTPNYIELLNPLSYFESNGIFATGAGTAGTVEYALEADLDNTFQLIAGTEANAMGIALWSDEDTWTWSTIGGPPLTTFRLTTTGPTNHDVTVTGLTTRELVQAINALNIPVKATLLLDYHDSAELQGPAGPFDIRFDGRNPVLYREHYFAYYLNETRFYLKPPLRPDRGEPWRPILNIGFIKYTVAGSSPVLPGADVTYSVPEEDWQNFSIYTAGKLERYREPSLAVRPNLIALRHRNIDMASVRLFVNGAGANELIVDYDKTAGLLKLSRDVLTADSVEVTYAYDYTDDFEVEHVDINPTELHRPDGYRVYWGIYITPSEITNTPSGPDPLVLKPVVGVVVGNTIAELQTLVDGILDPTNAFQIAAKLVGVYQVTSQEDGVNVQIVDIRSLGGGVKEDIDLRKAVLDNPETQFYADIGYWEGEPYAGSGVLIVEGPAEILGNANTLPLTEPPADGSFVDTTGTQNVADIRRRLKKHTTAGQYNVVDLD